MNYEKWYWILREHIGEDTWVDIYDANNNQCPGCSKQLTEGCCIECGEVYDPNP